MKTFCSHLTTMKSVIKLGPSNLHHLAYQLDGYQSKSVPSMKISTHSSNPNMLASASAADLVGNQLHMHDPVSCKYTTQQMGISTNFNCSYSCCFERWVGPDYLILFQVSVDMFVLVCRVELLCFAPFWIRPNSGSKFPDYIWAHPGTYLFQPSFPLNEHVQHILWSVQNPPISLFTLQ